MPLKKQQDALLKNKGREDGRHTVGVVSSLATTRPAAKLKGARPSESSYQRPLPRQHPQRGQGTRSMRLAAAGRGGGKGVGVIVQWKQPQQRMKGHDNGIRDAGIKTRACVEVKGCLHKGRLGVGNGVVSNLVCHDKTSCTYMWLRSAHTC